MEEKNKHRKSVRSNVYAPVKNPEKLMESPKILDGGTKGQKDFTKNRKEIFQDMEKKFYNALDHEIRREILRMMGKNGCGTFTQFKKRIKVSTGTIYHHLNILRDLISQNKNREYILTTLGIHAYNFLIQNYDSFESTNITEQRIISERLKRFISFIPIALFEKIKLNPLIGWIISGIIWIFSFLLIVMGAINSSFIFFLPFNGELTDLMIFYRLLLGVKYLGAVALSAIISELLCRFLFRKNDNTQKFFAVYSVGLFPMLIYLLIFDLFVFFAPSLVDSVINKILMIFFQGWSIWWISYIIISFKYIKLERSLLITFLIHYVAFNLLLFT
ncbi:MAG: hypothetical protein ACTSWY_01705 [Promethearchaeota archaeon]